jgi:hypothetical protein
MLIPPKKLAAFMQSSKKPFGKDPEDDEEDEGKHPEPDGDEDEPEGGGDNDGDEGGGDQPQKPDNKLAAFMQGKPGGPPAGGGGPPQGGPGQQGAGAGKDYTQLVEEEAKRVESGNVDQELMDQMADFDPMDNPPEWAAQPDIWTKAEDAVDPEGAGAQYDEPYAVVAHVYKRMGGKIR